MDKYITKEQAIDEVWDAITMRDDPDLGRVIEENIERVPAADVVEVVRCKNCKHYTPFDNLDYGTCTRWYNERVEENYFCGEGKRKEGDSNG